MKVNFEYTKKDYKKYLYRSRFVNNIILFIIGVIIYFVISHDNFLVKYFLLYLVGLIALLFLINKLYVIAYLKVNEMLNYSTYGKYMVELTPNKFSITVNKSKTEYKYNNISKIIIRKKYFKIKFKNSREFLTFEKKLFDISDYEKMIKQFESKLN